MKLRERLWTYEDYARLEDDRRYEVIEGELLEMPAPRVYHQRLLGKLFRVMSSFVEGKDLGEVFISPVDVVFDEVNVFQPDLVFVSKERLHIVEDKGIFGTPDLVVEVVSPSTFKRDTEDKRRLYERFGVKELWLVFPEEKVVEVLTLKDKGYEVFSHAYEKGKVCSKLLDGFCVELETLFEKTY